MKGPERGENMQKTILMVEDNRDYAAIFGHLLEKNGYKVLLNKDGAEALNTLLNEKVDLVITDLKMDWVEGDFVVQLVKTHQKTAHIPVIVLTSLPRDEIADFNLEGVDAIFEKSIDYTIILDKIREKIQTEEITR